MRSVSCCNDIICPSFSGVAGHLNMIKYESDGYVPTGERKEGVICVGIRRKKGVIGCGIQKDRAFYGVNFPKWEGQGLWSFSINLVKFD